MQKLMGLNWYRKFILNLSVKISKISNLLKNKIKNKVLTLT